MNYEFKEALKVFLPQIICYQAILSCDIQDLSFDVHMDRQEPDSQEVDDGYCRHIVVIVRR
jgi:hypothetical protein